MKPQQKRLILFLGLIALGLMLTLFACMQYPPKSVPTWIPVAWGCYVLAAITFTVVFGPRIFKSPPAPVAPTSVQTPATSAALRLMAVWIGLFLYGAFKFAKGDIPADRAIPTGVLLLAWIFVFGWFMRRDVKQRREAGNVVEGGPGSPR